MLSIALLITLTLLCIFVAVKFSELRFASGMILIFLIIFLVNSLVYERYRIPIGYFGIVNQKCSIVDDWVYPNYDNATGAFKFNSDKSFNYSSTFFSISRYGTWEKVDECTYLLIYQNGDTQTVSISNDMFYIGETGYIRY